MLPQLVSVFVLSATSIFVILRNPGPYKVLITLIALLFLLPSVIYLLPSNKGGGIDLLLTFSYSLENTLAYILLVTLFWGLTMLLDIGPFTILSTVVLSVILAWITWDPKWRPLQPVIRSFCVLFAMMTATFALIRGQKNGIWMVLALMSLAFALKPQMLAPLLTPFESHNYLKAAAIFFTNRAVLSENTPLFGKKAP